MPYKETQSSIGRLVALPPYTPLGKEVTKQTLSKHGSRLHKNKTFCFPRKKTIMPKASKMAKGIYHKWQIWQMLMFLICTSDFIRKSVSRSRTEFTETLIVNRPKPLTSKEMGIRQRLPFLFSDKSLMTQISKFILNLCEHGTRISSKFVKIPFT